MIIKACNNFELRKRIEEKKKSESAFLQFISRVFLRMKQMG